MLHAQHDAMQFTAEVLMSYRHMLAQHDEQALKAVLRIALHAGDGALVQSLYAV